MKKQMICIILSAAVVLLGTAVAVSFGMRAQEAVPAEAETKARIPLYQGANHAPVFAAQLSDQSDNQVFTSLNQTGKDSGAVYNDIFAYKLLKKLYRPSAEALATIDALLEKGADVAKVIEIYEFWLTTSENASIIAEIYDRSNTIQDIYWVEDLFNEVTNNRHGVLDRDGINQYLAQGLTTEDIKIANVLCRKGAATITEILDRRAAGESWPALIAEIIDGQAGEDAYISEMVSSIQTEQELVNYIYYRAIFSNASVAAAYSEDIESENNAEEQIAAYRDELVGEVYQELVADGVSPAASSEENQAVDARYRELIEQNGIPSSQIDAMQQEGHTLQSILNASEQSKAEGEPAAVILEQEKQELAAQEGGMAQ